MRARLDGFRKRQITGALGRGFALTIPHQIRGMPVSHHLHPRREFLARRIRDAQPAVGNLAPGVFQHQLRAKSRRLDLAPLTASRSASSPAPAGRSSTTKSCRTPSMLTVYSSTSPGRVKRTLWPSMDTLPLATNWRLRCWMLRCCDASVRYSPPIPGAHRSDAPYLCRHQTETVVHRVGDGRSQPQAFARGLAFEPLENAAQPRALGGGSDGQPVALVIRAGLRAELRPRDGLEAFAGAASAGSVAAAGRPNGETLPTATAVA